jgi:hypothetical protein
MDASFTPALVTMAPVAPKVHEDRVREAISANRSRLAVHRRSLRRTLLAKSSVSGWEIIFVLRRRRRDVRHRSEIQPGSGVWPDRSLRLPGDSDIVQVTDFDGPMSEGL